MIATEAAVAPETYRLSRHQYDRMVEVGVLGEDDRVELLEGVICTMSPQGNAHAHVIRRLNQLLVVALQGRAWVSPQLPLAASDYSEPEPDLAVTWLDEGADDHPTRAYLVVEVAYSSQRTDLGTKARVYAQAGVPQYWVVDLPAGVVHEHRGPTGGGYAEVIRRGAGEVLVIDAFPDVTVAVDGLLG